MISAGEGELLKAGDLAGDAKMHKYNADLHAIDFPCWE
jgi:hypothetical protein